MIHEFLGFLEPDTAPECPIVSGKCSRIVVSSIDIARTLVCLCFIRGNQIFFSKDSVKQMVYGAKQHQAAA